MAARQGLVWLTVLLLLALAIAASLAADTPNNGGNKKNGPAKKVIDFLKGMVVGSDDLATKVEDLLDTNKWETLSKQAGSKKDSGKVKAQAATGVPNPFPDFGWEIDPKCLESKESYYYRSWDGSCNWLRKGQAATGAQDQAYARDYTPPHYKPGTLGEPRDGPNVRELSNIFFKNRKTGYWDHTPWLLGYVEFLVHDLMLSDAGREKGDLMNIDIPAGDPDFPPKTKLEFWRSERAPGTGENGIPREQYNRRSNWMDLETIYGSTKEMNALLRQKDAAGALKCELILDDDYLPVNDERFNFSLPGRPGQQRNLFAAGDLRANQDYLLMVYQTLFVREHNRMCGVLHGKYPDWNVEQRFQTTRIVMGAKMNMIGAAYFKAYFIDVPWPDDPTAIMRSWTGKTVLEINPLTMSYPWQMLLNPKTGDPYSLPNEFSVGYRWHDLIPASLQIFDKENNPTTLVNLAETAFNATSFKQTGINSVVEAMSVTQIPDFHSGIQDTYRSMKFNFRNPDEGNGFDLAAWAIMHERERGLPTFNEYIRKVYDGVVPFKPRATFEEFTSNVYFQQELKRLYKTPDDVDLWVGQELDEEWWPNTHIPRSMLIINFYTLFKAAAADRFGINWGMFWCISNYKPWNCPTTNVLQDLLWKPNPLPLFPNAKLPDSFWWEELDLQNQGTNLLHRMVTQNTGVKCLQKNLFFVANAKSNPIECFSTGDMPSPDDDKSFLLDPFFKNDDLHFLPFALWGSVQPFVDYTKQYGDVVKFKLSNDGNNILLSNANDLGKIFESDKYWLRSRMDYSDFTYGRMVGYKDGTPFTALSNSHPSELYKWKRLRTIFDTQITPANINQLPTINVSAKKLLATFDQHVGKKYDAADDETGVALELACSLAYGDDFCQRDPARLQQFVKYGKRWLKYFPDFLKYAPPYNNPILVLEGKTSKIKDAMDFFGQFSRDALAEVRKSPAGKTSWLAKWALTPTEDGSLLDDKEVIAATFDSFMGIPPTFSFILGHGMYLLAKNPTVLERAYREVSAVLTTAARDLTIADFHRMPYLLKVVREIYRYYPPGGQIYARVSMEDDTLRDWQVPAGTTYMIHTASIHQDPRFWANPTEFNPDRFDTPVANNTWIPFGGGKKDCPGKDLALQVSNAFFAHLIRNFKWTYAGEDPPVIRMLLSAAPKDPFLFKLQRRSAKDEL